MFILKSSVMQFIRLPVKDAVLVQHPRYGDPRGFLEELYNAEKYPPTITQFFPVQQVTAASSVKNVVRGLHFSPYCKLLSCTQGSVYDVVVDLRPDSPTYLKWAGALLTATNCRQLFVPPDCGHGYFALEEGSSVTYCQGGCFRPSLDKGISPFDKLVNVRWRLDDGCDYVISDKDKAAPRWTDFKPDSLSITQSRQRVLIIGINSQTGWALCDVLEGKGQYVVYGTSNTVDHEGSMKLDLASIASDKDICHTILNACRPHVLVICSAFSLVDGCETDPEKSENVNVKGTLALARECSSFGSKVVYFSSNYVFGDRPYNVDESNDFLVGEKGVSETDTTGALNTYGKHKVLSETEILKMSPENVIIRVSHVYGPSVTGRNNNFVYQMSRAFRNKIRYICSTTEVVVPTYTYDIARSIAGLLEKDAAGIFHVCGPQAFSKHEWAMQLGRILQLDSSSIEKLDGKMPSPAERPRAAVMCTAKVRECLGGLNFRTLKEGIEHWRSLGRGEPF